MSLEKVVEDILRRGEERRQEIIRQGERERDEFVAQADVQMEEHRQKASARADAHISQMEQQELSSAELESKKALLSAQRQVMDELKAQVLAEMSQYPAEKRAAMYARLMGRAKKELGECYVYSNSADKTLLKLPPGMTDGGVIDCRGGLVFESGDRAVRLDYRFESMLEDVWNRKIQEIYSGLFG
ncbi:MAG: V-type ATP synthase subunit E family protein [Candidatus Thermoplasmatota archaeon]